jgi:septal ring factor EnvC (AmiA/AmiB activator)
MNARVQGLFGLVFIFLALAAFADSAGSEDSAEVEKTLEDVRKQILKLEKATLKEVKRRGTAEQKLRQAEVSESDVRKKLQQVDKDLAGTRDRLAALEDQARETESELTQHRSELDRQLRLAYAAGQEDWLRTVLSQRDPVQISRQMVYQSYIAKQRSGLMDAVRSQLQALIENAAAVSREQEKYTEIKRVQQTRLDELSDVRKTRRLALADIEKGIVSQNDRLTQLKLEAEDLESLVTELNRLFGGLSIGDATPFADRKGQMSWPTDGQLIRKFGEPKADGRLRWDGVLLATGAGKTVQAVHHGRVVYSDWLPGMGLLVVVEHGDGYLSLYGHNQDLIMEVGEWVTPGTVIAHVGDSGGQSVPGLYFEIRKNGSPVNPSHWVKR